MDNKEEATLIQTLWGKGTVTPFDRLLFRNFFHVANRPAEDLPAYLRREPSGHIAIVACSDCQVDPNDIFKLHPGEAIILQNGGNASNPDLIRSLIVAVYELGVTHIIVLGHVNCTFKGLNVEHLEMKTNQTANINAQSFGFSDPKVFYRPIDDVLDNTLQQAKILRTHPLFKSRVEILPMLYDDAKGFVYNADTLQASRTMTRGAKVAPVVAQPTTAGDTQITIKSDTPKEIAAEIQKLINKFPGNNAFVIKVLRNWQWDKYVEERAKSVPRRESPTMVSLHLSDVLKSAAVEKLATLNKLIPLMPPSPSSPLAISLPAMEVVFPETEGPASEDMSSKQAPIEKASVMTSATTKVIAATLHAAQMAIPSNLVAQVPRVIIPKIHIPRAHIPRLRFVVEYPEEKIEPEEEMEQQEEIEAEKEPDLEEESS